jgi:hypothetical protein
MSCMRLCVCCMLRSAPAVLPTCFVSLHVAVNPNSHANLLHCLCMLRSAPAVLPTCCASACCGQPQHSCQPALCLCMLRSAPAVLPTCCASACCGQPQQSCQPTTLSLHAAVNPPIAANLLHFACLQQPPPSNAVLLRRMQSSVVCDVTYRPRLSFCPLW